ncbi:hypothetical protein [Candidatus Reidiella endopervernicosa]|uniref:ATP-grasp domain-containing protein n=1 Tax=Candidatus Reidiella endopervernicosa TaxID=2738883 RepID=A0A6N0I0P9_9GAMM|nr:hypothetical protein [Candidatus Reidiella endopervernicosa]QKQ28066.1 hypothetical protein HUE57_18585 [Candidatus Reidiella endopervernicosa]
MSVTGSMAGVIAYALARFWRQRGYEVRFHRGVEDLPEADVVLMHLRTTRQDESYLKAVEDYPRVLNRNARDISKRLVSSHLLDCESRYEGPVIVKSNDNYMGLFERQLRRQALRERGGLHRRWRHLLARKAEKRLRCALWKAGTSESVEGYWVLPELRAVPSAIWRDDRYVVERFLPERSERGYLLREWIFLGDREFCTASYSSRAVFKQSDLTPSEPAPVPEVLRQRRRELGLDFGGFQFVQHGEQVVLFDVNQTPAILSSKRLKLFESRLALLAEGLDGYLQHGAGLQKVI